MSTPTDMYCLVCKTHRPVNQAKLIECPFTSKSGKTMTRYCWNATCSQCHKQINQFAKKEGGIKPPTGVAPVPVNEPLVL